MRALEGDFSAHVHGMSAEPEVRALSIKPFCAERGWSDCALLLASDGVWDMWTYEEVAERLVPKPSSGEQRCPSRP